MTKTAVLSIKLKMKHFWSNVFGSSIFRYALFHDMITIDINRCLRKKRERFTFLLSVKRSACKSLLLMCLGQFNTVVLSGNIPDLHLVLGLELAGCVLYGTIIYVSWYAIQKKY